MKEFEDAHQAWLQDHLDKRSGERKGRLGRGHAHGERLFLRQVWWPVFGGFEGLHPEYEILDWRGKAYYADFAWLPGHVRIVFEIKGFGPHVQDMDRKRFCEELNREAFLQGIGYRVVSFAYDGVSKRPELCMTILRLLKSRYQPSPAPLDMNRLIGKEIILLAYRTAAPIKPLDVERHTGLNHRTVIRHLQALVVAGWFRPAGRKS